MYDVYLGGYTDTGWRNSFCDSLSEDISVFDPIVEGYEDFDITQKANQVAQELEMIETSSVVVFYLHENWKSYFSMLELGDAVGRGKQVIVCIDTPIDSEEKIRRYCEYRGMIIVSSLDELVTTVEECIGQMELCEVVNAEKT